MVYYKINLDGCVHDLEKARSENNEGIRFKSRIKRESAEYNKNHPGTFYAVSELDRIGAEIAVISKYGGLTTKDVKDYLNFINIGDFDEMMISEGVLICTSGAIQKLFSTKIK